MGFKRTKHVVCIHRIVHVKLYSFFFCSHRINFNCLTETLCLTNLHLLVQFGSSSATGLGKSSLLGYMFDDKRRESFFTDTTDASWRSGCIDVLFSNRFVIFDVHGEITDKKLLRAIQLYAYIQIIYLTEQDLQTDFLEKNLLPHSQIIVVIFDTKYDKQSETLGLLKRFEEKYKQLKDILWTTAPMLNNQINILPATNTRRKKNLRKTFSQLFNKINSNKIKSTFRSCFQIQYSFFQCLKESLSLHKRIEPVFEIEQELHHLFSSLSDVTENLRLVTPVTYQHSHFTRNQSNLPNTISINDYHKFTISLLTERHYIELLMVEIYLNHWRATYIPKLREEQEYLRTNMTNNLQKLKRAE